MQVRGDWLWSARARQKAHRNLSFPSSSHDSPDPVYSTTPPNAIKPNSLKCIVTFIILNEVEKKGITIEDLLFAYKVNRSPSNKPYWTFYFTSRRYFLYTGKQPIDKDWETTGGLYVISGAWASSHFNGTAFPLINNFSRGKLLCFSNTLPYLSFNKAHWLILYPWSSFFHFFFLVGIPATANIDMPKERIEALLHNNVYHLNLSNARDLDSICTTEAMQCLIKYALHLTFLDPTFSLTIRLAQETICHLQQSVNRQLDIAIEAKVNFDVSRALESLHCLWASGAHKQT